MAIPPGQTFVVAAAGDIAGRETLHHETAQLLLALRRDKTLAAILPLGDLQYPRGKLDDFLRHYDSSWGIRALKELTRPVPGNHEYDGGRQWADGYFDYWNGQGKAVGLAGERDRGYYSYDIGDWHFVALNTSDGCRLVPCGPGSAMHAWLVADLRATERKCVLAYMHHPRFQQGRYHGDTRSVAPLWDALYDAGADLVLAGHEHNFQQLAPLDKQGQVTLERGMRSFVVGTGGARPYVEFKRENTDRRRGEVTIAGQAGILELTLGPQEYEWRFVVVGGQALAHGRDRCR